MSCWQEPLGRKKVWFLSRQGASASIDANCQSLRVRRREWRLYIIDILGNKSNAANYSWESALLAQNKVTRRLCKLRDEIEPIR